LTRTRTDLRAQVPYKTLKANNAGLDENKN
jgi:hypothetical protein